MSEFQDNRSEDHFYEEIQSTPSSANGGYLTPISQDDNSETNPKCTGKINSNEPRYVPYDGNICSPRSPVTNGCGINNNRLNQHIDNHTHNGCSQRHSLLREEAPYSDPSQTYLKTTVVSNDTNHINENSGGGERDRNTPLLPNVLPATEYNAGPTRRTKEHRCLFDKIPKRTLITAISVVFNLILLVGLAYTATTLFRCKVLNEPDPPNPVASRLKRSVCLYYKSDQLRDLGVFHDNGHNTNSQFYVFIAQEGQRLYCKDNAEHLQWLIKMVNNLLYFLLCMGEKFYL